MREHYEFLMLRDYSWSKGSQVLHPSSFGNWSVHKAAVHIFVIIIITF